MCCSGRYLALRAKFLFCHFLNSTNAHQPCRIAILGYSTEVGKGGWGGVGSFFVGRVFGRSKEVVRDEFV